MTELLLLDLFGEIDDRYIREAMPKIRTKTKTGIIRFSLVAAAVLFMVISVYTMNTNWFIDNGASNSTNDGPSATSTYVYYNGYIYGDHGKLVSQLPNGATLLGEINNVGDDSSGGDLEGNEDGYIYADSKDDSVLYFWAKIWDESIAGQAKYVVLVRENI